MLRLSDVRNWWDRVIDAMALAAGGLILLMMVGLTYSVVTRRLLDQAVAWTTELGGYALLYITFLGAPWLVRRSGHVTVDLVLSRLRPETRRKVDATNAVLTAFVASLLVWYGTTVTWRAVESSAVITNILSTPKYLLLMIIPLGSLFIVVEYLRQATRHWR